MQGLQNIPQLLAVCPDLAMMNAMNTLAYHLAGLRTFAYSNRSRSKALEHEIGSTAVEQQNTAHPAVGLNQVPEHGETGKRSIT
jgi:hypothetical protein